MSLLHREKRLRPIPRALRGVIAESTLIGPTSHGAFSVLVVMNASMRLLDFEEADQSYGQAAAAEEKVLRNVYQPFTDDDGDCRENHGMKTKSSGW